MKPSTMKSRKTSGLLPPLGLSPLVSRRAALMLATGALLFGGNAAFAAGVWVGATDNYDNASNWDNGVVPSGINIDVSNGGTILITDNHNTNDILAGTGANKTGSYLQTAGTIVQNGGWFRLGQAAGSVGNYTLQGGSLTTVGQVNIGEQNGGTGNVTVGGGAGAAQWTNNGNQLSVGGADATGGSDGNGKGTGTLTVHANGTITDNNELWIGNNLGSVGTLTMDGGAITTNNYFAVGRQSATGTVNQSGGTITKTGNGNIEIGTFNNGANVGTGFYNLSGTGVVNDNSGADLIGNGGTGTMTISGGTFNMNGAFTSIGAGSTGTMTITGGSYTNGGGQDFNVADNGGTHGTLNVSGTGILNTKTGNFYVGKNGTGVANLGSGVAGGLITAKGVIGSAGGTFNFNGGTLQANATNTAFIAGLAAANVQAGGAVIDTNGNTDTIGQALLHSGTGTDGGLTVADSTGTGTLILTGANTYNGTTNINAGTVSPTTASSFGTTGNVTFGGGTLLYTTNTADYSGRIKNSAGAVSLNTNGLNETLASAIDGSNTGGLTKTGTGTLTLSAANTYTGATTVTTGSLTLDHSGANTGSLGNTAVSIGANTLLVKGSTTIGSPGTGSLAVGAGTVNLQDGNINTLGIGGPLALNGSSLNFDLGSASGVNDAINVGGAVTNTGTTTLNLDALGSIVSGTSAYTLLTAASGLGSGFTLGTEPAGFNAYSLTSSTPTAEILSITANPTVVGAEYWTGAASRTLGDTANNFSDSANSATQSNFSTDRAGTMDPKQVPGATTDLIFTANNATPIANALNTQLDGAYTIHSLTFDVPASTTILSTTINTNGKTLTLGAGGLVVAATSNSSGTINGTGSIILNGSQSFADNSALGLTISAPIAGNAASGTNTLTFAGTGSGPVGLSGPISDGILGGNEALAVSKTGGGVLTLSGANTYTGGTTLNSGQVVLGSATALGAATGVLTFGAGSTSDLQLAGHSITTGGLNTNATVGTPIIENASATPATLTNSVASGTDTFGGVLQDGAGGGALSLTETGGGVQTLTGANTYTGGTTVNAPGGGLALGAGGTLGAATGNTTVTAGTLDLGGQSVTQTELILSGGNVIGPTGTLTLGSAGTAILLSSNGYTFAAPADTANLVLNGGNIVKTATNGNPNIAGNITLGSGTSTVALVDTPGDAFPELTLGGVISGPGALTQDNTLGGTSTQEFGSLLLSGANTYTGGTNITVGRTEIANSTALGTGAVTVGSRGTLALGGGAVQNVNGGNLTVANNLTLNHTVGGNYSIDAIQNNFGANTLTGTISLQAPLNAFTVNGGSLNQTGVISGTGALNKYSGSQLTLSGANTYSGGTGINGGTLNVNSAETPGTSGPLGSGGTITFGGGTLQYSANNNADYSNRFATVTNQAFNIDTNGQNVTYASPLVSTGTSALNKFGVGTLDLTASGSALATTTIRAGAVTVDNGAGLTNTGLATIGSLAGDNGTLNVTGTGQFTAGSISVATTGTAIGTVNQTGGTVSQTAAVDFRIGGYNSAGDAAAVGTYNLSGGTLSATGGNFQVGGYGHGTLNQTGGTVNSSFYTDSGRYAGGVGLIDVEGGNFNQTNTGTRLIDGEQGTGVITTGGTGTITSSGGLILGLTATGNGTFNLNTGGTLVTPSISGGTTPGVTALGTAVVNFNGGTLKATSANASFVSGVTTNVLAGGAVINTNGNNDGITTILAGSAGDGGLTKTGAGTLTLTGTNTYNGATTVTAGTLQVGNGTAGSIGNTSAVNVGGGATLAVNNNGALSNTAATLTLGNGSGNGTLQNALNGTVNPADMNGNVTTNNVQRAGTLSLGTGTSDILDFANNAGTFDFTGADTSLSPGQSLTIQGFGVAANEMLGAAPTGTEVGSYQLLIDSGLTPTQLGDISFLNSDATQMAATQELLTSGTNAGKYQILEGSPAPEPAQTAALGLFGLGLGALILKARKRKAAGTAN